MAMHKPKKTKRFQPGGLVDERGNAVLDGSNQPIMTGSFPEEDEITARGRAKNAEMFRSLFNRATGQGKSVQDEAGKVAQMAAAEKKLAQDVQDKLKADKAAKDDADFAEADRVSSTARAVAGKPAAKTTPAAKSGIVTKEELEKSGLSLRDYMNKQKGLTRRDGTAPSGKAKTAAEYSDATDAMRNRSRMAANSANKKSSTTDALRAKSRKEAAFEGAKRMAKTSEGQAQRKAQEKGQAIERVTPEEYIVGGGASLGLKSLNQMAKNLAKPKIKEYKPTMLPAPKSAAKADIKALEAPRQRLTYDKAGAKEKERAERAAERTKQMRRDNAERGGSNADSINLKKGGRVTVSSASKRADGIAQRGKTRGKVY